MNQEKRNEKLSLSSTSMPSVFNNSGREVPVSSHYGGSDQLRIVEEWNKQTSVIAGHRALTIFAAASIGEMHSQINEAFNGSAAEILADKFLQDGHRAQDFIEEFDEKQVQLLAKHLWGVLEVGASNIGMEVHRPLYPPAIEVKEPIQEPEPFSVRRFLFG